MKNVVGYIRVSTQRQADLGGSLDEQAYVVRGYCSERGLKLLTLEEDDCSAAGPQGHLFRPGLRKAIRIAKEKKASLLVPSADRLGRHPAVLSEIFDSNIPIISIAERRQVGRRSLERLLRRAELDRDDIASRAREGMARAKKRGVKLGNPKNLEVAQRNGAISNALRADQKVQDLADFIERTPGWESMTLREKVDLLNRSGLHNPVSEKRSERRPWTLGSLRKPLKRAEAELDFRKEIEKEPVDISGFQATKALENHGADVRSGDLKEDHDESAPMDSAYKNHPDFGKF